MFKDICFAYKKRIEVPFEEIKNQREHYKRIFLAMLDNNPASVSLVLVNDILLNLKE
jgi:hypothetical protein